MGLCLRGIAVLYCPDEVTGVDGLPAQACAAHRISWWSLRQTATLLSSHERGVRPASGGSASTSEQLHNTVCSCGRVDVKAGMDGLTPGGHHVGDILLDTAQHACDVYTVGCI